MTQRPGRLSFSPEGNTTLNGLRLAIRGAGRPLIEATNFIRGNGFERNEPVIVTGDDGFLGNLPVFFFTNIIHAGQSVHSFNLDLGEKSNDWATKSEIPHLRQMEKSESALNENDSAPVKKREGRISAGIWGVATLIVIITLVILSKKNSDRS